MAAAYEHMPRGLGYEQMLVTHLAHEHTFSGLAQELMVTGLARKHAIIGLDDQQRLMEPGAGPDELK